MSRVIPLMPRCKRISLQSEADFTDIYGYLDESKLGKNNPYISVGEKRMSLSGKKGRERRVSICLKFYSGTRPSYLTGVLSLRLVGAAGARINVRSSYSQLGPTMTWVRTKVLRLQAQCFYHYATLLSYSSVHKDIACWTSFRIQLDISMNLLLHLSTFFTKFTTIPMNLFRFGIFFGFTSLNFICRALAREILICRVTGYQW